MKYSHLPFRWLISIPQEIIHSKSVSLLSLFWAMYGKLNLTESKKTKKLHRPSLL